MSIQTMIYITSLTREKFDEIQCLQHFNEIQYKPQQDNEVFSEVLYVLALLI